jgi:8-oxo-dGTP pyrophosphatase MutT (NUDIX family)
MPISSSELHVAVGSYLDAYPDEKTAIAPLLEALVGGEDITTRANLAGHITCSAAILHPNGRVLHIHHRTLELWLLPGGHLEHDDTSLTGAALREAVEETGILASALAPLAVGDGPLHIDIHRIPASARKNEPEHWHYDLTYAFALTNTDVRTELQLEEVTAMTWRHLDNTEPEALRVRLQNLTKATA